MARLKDKVVLVTGAGSGIGREIVLQCAIQGAKIEFCDINAESGKETEKILNSASGQTGTFTQVDVAAEDQVEKWISKVAQKHGQIDVLVNNAVVFQLGSVESVTSEQWDRVLSVNVKGYAFCCKYCIPVMRQKKSGSIINMGSVSSFVAQSEFVPYNTTKGAILQLTRCIAMDVGADKIRVNTVVPGIVDTPIQEIYATSIGTTKEELIKGLLGNIMIPRIGTPTDVAHAVVFLASDESTYVTASTITVDGGYLSK